MKRTVEISQKSYLSLQNKQLIINQNGNAVAQIPVEDLGKLILNDPRITMTQAVMVETQKNNVSLIVCDEKHLPISTMLPLTEGNKLHNRVLRDQVAVRVSTKNRLWQDIVKQKIANQSRTLEYFDLPAQYLKTISSKVKSGDPSNMEATAARYYWKTLFGEAFRRRYHDDNDTGINALLNYGYAILRASVARSLVGTGLHPALGVHHQNQYDGLALADDVMEPFRPWVDWKVKELSLQQSDLTINKENKRVLLMLLEEKVLFKESGLPFLIALEQLASHFKLALKENHKNLVWPTR